MENRVILHSDANCFFASVEMATNPDLKGLPLAVCGAVEERHGIVLAKSGEAGRTGIKTGMTVGDAKKLCPSLTVVHPHYDKYMEYSHALKQIYADFSDRVEPFGMDECWLDISPAIKKYEDGMYVSQVLRERVKKELGITVSVGVSFNKVFAKLGSDMKKPDASTLITPDNFKKRVFPLPVSALLGVGRATATALEKYGITTIGALASCEPEFLRRTMGKAGISLWRFANGLDTSPVLTEAERPPIKSVGNGMTPPRDLCSRDDVRIFMLWLSLEIGKRLRSYGMRCKGVSISLRDTSLRVKQLQAPLVSPTDDGADIGRAAYGLFLKDGRLPLRSVSVTAISLESAFAPLQTDFFTDPVRVEKHARLNKAVDTVCQKYGDSVLLPASLCKKSFSLSKSGHSLPV